MALAVPVDTAGGEVPRLLAGQLTTTMGRAHQGGPRPRSTPTASTCGRASYCWTPPPRDRGAVASDAATLRVIWDRAGHQAEPAAAERVGLALAKLAP